MSPRTPSTILLFGSTGQVGFELARVLGPLGRVVTPGRADVDLLDRDAVRRYVVSQRPALVVNAAAYTAVDLAESNEREAFLVNATAPTAMAEGAQEVGAAIVHYSTDYVFDGSKPAPYVESDAVNPLSVYGRSKLGGEQGVLGAAEAAFVLRTSWVFSARGRNFLLTMLRLGAERPELRIVDDQVGAPTSARSIAAATALIWGGLGRTDVERVRGAARARGVYHLTAAGHTSWHGFATEIARLAFREGTHQCRTIVPIATTEYPTPATRPANSRLSNEKLLETFGLALPAWEEQLRLTVEETAG